MFVANEQQLLFVALDFLAASPYSRIYQLTL